MTPQVEMTTVKVGVVYQSHGYINVQVPAGMSPKATLQYVQDLEDKTGSLPLPADPEFIDDSFEIDSIDGLCVEEITTDEEIAE